MTKKKNESLTERVTAFERRALVVILRRAKGVVAEAARLAGRNRTEFYRLIARHKLNPTDFRRESGAEPGSHALQPEARP